MKGNAVIEATSSGVKGISKNTSKSSKGFEGNEVKWERSNK
jgi:hypothetical protein